MNRRVLPSAKWNKKIDYNLVIDKYNVIDFLCFKMLQKSNFI